MGIAEAAVDTNLLLGAVLGKSRTELFLSGNLHVTKPDEEIFLQRLERRRNREPVAYILGTKEFWSLPFWVSPDVLIPRPETEFLVEKVLEIVKRKKEQTVLDLCCGSGVIACVLAKELGCDVTASDISSAALAMAKKNAAAHSLEQQITFVQSNLFDNMDEQKKYSMIVSNPPYVSTDDIKNNVEPEVACYEPSLALDGGEKGLDIIAKICNRVGDFLIDGGHFFMEFGADQGAECKKMFEHKKCFSRVEIYRDYAGRDRVLYVCKG